MSATTLEELVVKIQADVSDLRAQFSEGQKIVEDSAGRMEGAIKNFSDNSSKHMGVFQGAMKTALGVFEGEALLEGIHKLGELIADTFKEIVVESINAASAHADAVNKMNNALALAGQYSREASDSMQEYAESLSHASTYSGTAVLGASALIETLGKLDEEGLKTATKASLDLAAALGIDLDTAARLVGKAAEGNVTTFARFGVQIEQGSTKAETFANAMEAINEKFGGSAANAVHTYSGAMAQLKNAQEEAHESLGKLIVENQAVLNVINAVTQAIQGNTEENKKNQQAYKELVAEGLVLAIESVRALVAAFDTAIQMGNQAITVLALPLKELIAGIVAAQQALHGDFAQAWETLKTNGVEAFKDIGKAFTEDSKLSKVNDTLLQIQNAAEKGLGAIQSGASASVTPINSVIRATQELTAAEVKLGEEGEKLAKKTLQDNDPTLKYADQVKALKAANEQKLISNRQFTDASEKLEADMETSLSKNRETEVNELLKQNEMMLALDADLYKEEIEANKASMDTILRQEEDNSTLRLAIAKKHKEETEAIERTRVDALKSSLGELASFQNAKSAEMAAVGKAAAITQTTIATYEGATKAASAVAGIPIVGPALAAAAAGAFIAAGLGRVAQISGMQLATGVDSVPGFGTKDSELAMLTPGERVVPKETNKDLKGFLAGKNPMVALLSEISKKLDHLSDTFGQQPIQVNVGGKTVIDTVRNELRAGRAFA